MTGAIEFLQKAKTACETDDINLDIMFAIIDCIGGREGTLSEADLVRKIMEYQIPDQGYKAEHKQAMIEMFDICDTCEDNQVMDCVYIENDDRKSCPKYRGEEPDD